MFNKVLKNKITTIVCAIIFVLVLALAIILPLTIKANNVNGNTSSLKKPGIEWDSNGGVKQKGEYTVTDNSIVLTHNETEMKDNYPNYDFINTKFKYSDFSVSTKITCGAEDIENAILQSKMGIKVSVDENQYFTVFLSPKNLGYSISLLSTLDGGASWVQIWNIPNASDYDEPVFDFAVGVNIKLVRNNGVIKVYLDEKLIHTEDNFNVNYKSDLKIGFTSEAINNVTYGDIVVTAQTLQKIVLEQPIVSLNVTTMSFSKVKYATKYECKAGENGKLFDVTSPLDVRKYCNDNSFTDGTYKFYFRAVNIDGARFTSSAFAVKEFIYSSSASQLATPSFTISGDAINFVKDANASSYDLFVNVGDTVITTVKQVIPGYSIADIKSNFMQVDEDFSFTIKAIGDEIAFIDSELSQAVVVKGADSWANVKGKYSAGANSVTLETQETTNGDNYPNYDLVYAKDSRVNFSVSATIKLKDVKSLNKAGIKLALSETSYFSVFTGDNGVIVILATFDGGATWLNIWTPGTKIEGADFEAGVNLMVERFDGKIRVYGNNVLVFSQDGFINDTVKKDTALKIGFTSEAKSGIIYSNIIIKDITSLTEA